MWESSSGMKYSLKSFCRYSKWSIQSNLLKTDRFNITSRQAKRSTLGTCRLRCVEMSSTEEVLQLSGKCHIKLDTNVFSPQSTKPTCAIQRQQLKTLRLFPPHILGDLKCILGNTIIKTTVFFIYHPFRNFYYLLNRALFGTKYSLALLLNKQLHSTNTVYLNS